MSQMYEKEIVVYEAISQNNAENEANDPRFSRLYYWVKGKKPVNQNYLTFAGDNLYREGVSIVGKSFEVEFIGESDEELNREAWADPIRSEILYRLSAENRSWYISFVGDFTKYPLEYGIRKVPKELIDYFSRKDPSQMTIIESREPFGYGKGPMNRLFFEVDNHELDWVVRNVWPAAYQGYPIEGYNFASGRIDLLKKWEESAKDTLLFQEILAETNTLFYTYPEEHRHFGFLTNKYDLVEFGQTIQLEELNRKVKKR